MPHQVIQYPNTEQETGVELTVTWGKESSIVQIGATRHVWVDRHAEQNRHTHSDHNHCSACPEPQRHSADELSDRVEPATVWSEPLTRYQINDLIRTLRRARDAVFGADA